MMTIHENISTADYFLPGFCFFRRGRILRGFQSLFMILLPLSCFALTSNETLRCYESMTLWVFLFFSGPEFAWTVLQPDIILHWIAAWTLIAWTAAVLVLHVRSIRQYEQKSDAPPTFNRSVFRRMMAVPSQRWAIRGLTAITLVILLGPLIIPHDPLAQKDITVTRLMKPLGTMYTVRTDNPSLQYKNASEHFLTIQRQLLQPEDGLIYANEAVIRHDTVVYRQGSLIQRLPVSGSGIMNEDEPVKIIRAWLGRDQYGRDVFSRLITGARISLLISILSVSLSVMIGLLIGALAGYAGGWTNSLLMRFVDMALAFPAVFLILLIMGLWGPSQGMLILVIGLSGWMGLARIVRGEVMSIKEKEFILAAKALGFGHVRIVFRHILPNAMTPVIVSATLRVGTVMIIEAGLSFLGLGIQPPTPSWGNMIHDGRAYLTDAWWISVFPGSAIVITVIMFNLIGDGLRDAWDARFR